MPGIFNLEIYRGDTWRAPFAITDTAGDPIDLTGVLMKAEVRDRLDGALMAEIGLTFTAPNIIDAELTAAQTAALNHGGVWDLQLTYTNGDVLTILRGDVTVTLDVSQAESIGTSLRLVR